ncbi:hypothetical protein GCM10027261_14220 [Geodermatophilus arenarius]|uniref:Uncharacterized protein n=1 Tax=Geodermatophilus arenarius TaxID=1137990 RepID=A0ABV9LIH2_9ACTN
MEFFSTVAQLLPVLMAASVFLLPTLRARKEAWRFAIIISGVAGTVALAICVLMLSGWLLESDKAWATPMVTVCALATIVLGGVGTFAPALGSSSPNIGQPSGQPAGTPSGQSGQSGQA